jgi:signal transduction histidine kinase
LFLQDIQAAAMRASGIIRNMLNFSRRSESKRGVCDLHNIVEQAVFLASSDYDLKKSYDFKRIEIVLDLAKDVPACMCTETDPRITIRLRSVEGAVRIEVADNGPGMSAEVQHKVFEPFFTTKPPGVGTGLGLSVSYFIVTRGHGGRMWVESAPGEGACFVLELPAKQDGGAHG